MLCDDCGENEAILHLTSIENNQIKSSYLCEQCASERGWSPGWAPATFRSLTFWRRWGKPTMRAASEGRAPTADSSWTTSKDGRLGCSHCYVAFEPHLRPLLRRLHGGTQHIGKVYLPPNPSVAQREERLAGLRRKLSKAVESEDFERAAQIRDLIKSLEGAV
jgi:protein arginine kinase activator